MSQNAADLINRHMERQIGKKKFNQRELRLSENNTCSRKRVLRCLEWEVTHPMTVDTVRNFEKGRAGEMYAESILEKHFPGRLIREAVVKHPFGDPHGEGHIDIEIPGYGLVEIKTVSQEKADYGLPVEDHVIQLMSYLHFHRDPRGKRYEKGEILYLVLERYGIFPKSFPVHYDPERGAAIEALMAGVWSDVLRNEPPCIPAGYHSRGFPCYWEMRQEGRATIPQFCEYHGHCWDEETLEFHNPPLMARGKDLEELFREYADASERYKNLSDEAALAKEVKAAMEPKLAAFFDAAGEKRINAGGITISRTMMPGRVTHNIDAAVLSGIISEAALAPFVRQGAGYEKYTVKRDRG